tara:strand:+ start:273 stop:485 length:213 start_codon:yes stop_codon:yes gene_type:complete
MLLLIFSVIENFSLLKKCDFDAYFEVVALLSNSFEQKKTNSTKCNSLNGIECFLEKHNFLYRKIEIGFFI